MTQKIKTLIYIMVIGFLAFSTYSFLQSDFDTFDLLNIFDKSGIYSNTPLEGKFPKYVFEDALEAYLAPEELEKTKSFSYELNGDTIEDTIWNIVLFESENIEYDYVKADYPTPVIKYWVNGEVEIENPNNTIQTPIETLSLKKGICTDYALLTASVLLNLNYSPVYILTFESEGNPGHAAAAVNINGKYYIIDQQPPVLELFNYLDYKKNNENYAIQNITFYKIEIKDEKVYYEVGFERVQDYDSESKKYSDIPELSKYLMDNFENNYGLSRDYNIQYLDSMEYLPKSYEKGATLKYFFTFPGYDTVFNKQYAVWTFNHAVNNINEENYKISDYNRIWVRSSYDGEKLTVIVNLAKK